MHQGLIIERANLKARDFQIDLAANLNKTRVNALGAPLSQQAGFYCDVCDCILKDSMAYLDHINGKWHNRALGMSMQTERSTTEQVRRRLEEMKKRKKGSSSLRSNIEKGEEHDHIPDGMSKTELLSAGHRDDFEHEEEVDEEEEEEEKEEGDDPAAGVVVGGQDNETSKELASEEIDVAALMGFGNFGGGVKR